MMIRCVQRCLVKQTTVFAVQRETGNHPYFIRSNGFRYLKEKMHWSSPIMAKAEEHEAPERAEQPTGGEADKRVPSRPQPLPVKGMKLERVERLGDESWAGVANVDRGAEGVGAKNVALLVAGDCASLLLFATIGRLSHGETLSVTESFLTALPFLTGWSAASYFFGGYGRPALESALKTAALSWAVGIPSGLLIRTLAKGYAPEKAFIIVSMAVTGVFLMGWRTAFAKFAEPLDSSLSPQEQLKKRTNRKGNPFEFISLLISLVKRW